MRTATMAFAAAVMLGAVVLVACEVVRQVRVRVATDLDWRRKERNRIMMSRIPPGEGAPLDLDGSRWGRTAPPGGESS